MARRVGVRLEEGGGARARGAVREALQPGDADPVVPRARAPDRVRDGAPLLERQVQGHAHGEAARLFQAPVGRQVCPGRRHMRSGSNAERRGVSEGARQRRVLLLGRRVRLDPTDEIERLILEDPDGLAGLRVAQDLTARWRGGVLGDAGYFHGSGDRKSTRLNSSHRTISYAVFCLKKKKLNINNTIDHRPEGDEKWFLENEKTVTQFCRKLAAERPHKDIRDEYNYPKKKGIKDECSRLLEASTMKSRRGFAIQRLMNAMRQFFF